MDARFRGLKYVYYLVINIVPIAQISNFIWRLKISAIFNMIQRWGSQIRLIIYGIGELNLSELVP